MGLQGDGWQVGWGQCGELAGWSHSPCVRCSSDVDQFPCLSESWRGVGLEGDITDHPGAA